MLYKATNKNTTSLTTLLAKATALQGGCHSGSVYAIPLTRVIGTRELEEYVCRLAARQARSFFRRGLNTMLCYPTTEGSDGGPLTVSRAHILNLTRYVSPFKTVPLSET